MKREKMPIGYMSRNTKPGTPLIKFTPIPFKLEAVNGFRFAPYGKRKLAKALFKGLLIKFKKR